jgi:hypothetical protein
MGAASVWVRCAAPRQHAADTALLLSCAATRHQQVPQYLFEQAVAAGQGGSTNIIICQPRRIAAVGLATRVAAGGRVDDEGQTEGASGLTLRPKPWHPLHHASCSWTLNASPPSASFARRPPPLPPELGDPAGVGGLAGYSVRLDSKVSSAMRLLFCTTGVLLRRLMSEPALTGVCVCVGGGGH